MKLEATQEEQTIKAGEEFGKRLRGGDVVLLFGKLGAGKTTFTKGIAKALNVPTRIISPTFIITRTHAANHRKIKQMYHLDLYRLESQDDIRAIDIKSMVDDESVVLIEWPELFSPTITPPYYTVHIEYTKQGRSIVIKHEQ